MLRSIFQPMPYLDLAALVLKQNSWKHSTGYAASVQREAWTASFAEELGMEMSISTLVL